MKTKLPFVAACAFGGLLLATTPLAAQPKKDGLEGVAALFLTSARTALKWDEPAEPARTDLQFHPSAAACPAGQSPATAPRNSRKPERPQAAGSCK